MTEITQKGFSFICSDDCFFSLLPFSFSNDIDFFSAIYGEGEFPCKKCHKDCLDHSPCIECSICGVWTHYECSKLTEHEFNTNPYFFCSERCEVCLLPFTDVKTSVLVKCEILNKRANFKPKKASQKNDDEIAVIKNEKVSMSIRPKCLECNKACRRKQNFLQCKVCKKNDSSKMFEFNIY